jgi:hypothetical protein
VTFIQKSNACCNCVSGSIPTGAINWNLTGTAEKRGDSLSLNTGAHEVFGFSHKSDFPRNCDW